MNAVRRVFAALFQRNPDLHQVTLRLPSLGIAHSISPAALDLEARTEISALVRCSLGEIGQMGGQLPDIGCSFANACAVEVEIAIGSETRAFTWPLLRCAAYGLPSLAEFIARRIEVYEDPRGGRVSEAGDALADAVGRTLVALDREVNPLQRFVPWHVLNMDTAGEEWSLPASMLVVGPSGSGITSLAIQLALRALVARPEGRCHVLGRGCGAGGGDGLVFGTFLQAIGRGTWSGLEPADVWFETDGLREMFAAGATQAAINTARPGDCLMVAHVDLLRDRGPALVAEAMARGVEVLATVQRVESAKPLRHLFAHCAYMGMHPVDPSVLEGAGLTDEERGFVTGRHPLARGWHRPALVKGPAGALALESALPPEAPILPLLAWSKAQADRARGISATTPGAWLEAWARGAGQ
jgi:hypothetical protein